MCVLWFKTPRGIELAYRRSYIAMVRHVAQQVTRKPWGMGRASVQKYRRQNVAFTISELLLERLDEEKVSLTGQLFPRGTLKKKASQKLFDWVHDSEFTGRTFTKPVLRLVVRKLLKKLVIPLDPENKNFVGQQSGRLRRFIRAAKRLKECEGLQKHHNEICKKQTVFLFDVNVYIYINISVAKECLFLSASFRLKICTPEGVPEQGLDFACCVDF